MQKIVAAVFAVVATLVLFAAAPPGAATSPIPLVRAHAHNDYAHEHPLYDALGRGFCSVEADICLIDGQLRVSHDPKKTQADRTLETLYLDPLLKRVRDNGGRVYRDGPEFTLLIDVKTDAEATYRVLTNTLARYTDMLSAFDHGRVRAGAITAIISGSRPRAVMAAEPVRYAALDGRLEDLDSDAPRDLIPLISDSWLSHFKWRGHGSIPEEEKQRLAQIVAKAHGQGRRVRFWAVPDLPAGWRELQAAGVDLINTDKLAELQHFLLGPATAPRGGPRTRSKLPFSGL